MDFENRYSKVSQLNELCNYYIDFINSFGNECAFTDSVVSKIKSLAKDIKEFGDN